MKPSCRVDNELVIQPQKFHLKMKSLIRTTKLKKKESTQDHTSVEPNRNPNDITRNNRLQSQDSSFSQIFVEQAQSSA